MLEGKYSLAAYCSNKHSVIGKEQQKVIRELTKNERVVIRKADKTNKFVLLDYDNYKANLNNILSDADKFIKISRDPTQQLKNKLNKISLQPIVQKMPFTLVN